MSTGQWLLVWFLGLIALGTVVLMLPGMAVPGGLTAIDALFTATTAVSVTGLMVVDIEQAFTPWGRVVILVLIQLGGIGIITFASVLILTTARKLSISYEDMLGATLASSRSVSVRHVAFAVVRFTILIEVIGTLVLFVLWPGDGPWHERLWSATFHAISAFCNAGISLYSDNLKAVADSSGVVLGMAVLIVLGGFGFTNFHELLNRWRKGTFRWAHFSLFLKVSIVLTVALNVSATAIFLIAESDIAFQSRSLGDAMIAAFFHAVTTRTAGFDIVPMTAFSDLSLRVMMLLMFIGAVSGSCAGGIKLSTSPFSSVWCGRIFATTVNRCCSIVVCRESIRTRPSCWSSPPSRPPRSDLPS